MQACSDLHFSKPPRQSQFTLTSCMKTPQPLRQKRWLRAKLLLTMCCTGHHPRTAVCQTSSKSSTQQPHLTRTAGHRSKTFQLKGLTSMNFMQACSDLHLSKPPRQSQFTLTSCMKTPQPLRQKRWLRAKLLLTMCCTDHLVDTLPLSTTTQTHLQFG